MVASKRPGNAGENPFDILTADLFRAAQHTFVWWNESTHAFLLANGLDQFWTRRVIQRLEDISFPVQSADNLSLPLALTFFETFLRPRSRASYGLARFLDVHANTTVSSGQWRNQQATMSSSL